jgi:hypothetical protein
VTDDEAKLAEYSGDLARQLRADLPTWVIRGVASRTDQDLGDAAAAAGADAARLTGDEIDVLLETDIDEQRTTPLALLRTAVGFPTAVLVAAGVPAVERDEFACRAFPRDRYDLSPASFADISPEAQQAGIVWGAAKAHVHLSRRRADTQR